MLHKLMRGRWFRYWRKKRMNPKCFFGRTWNKSWKNIHETNQIDSTLEIFPKNVTKYDQEDCSKCSSEDASFERTSSMSSFTISCCNSWNRRLSKCQIIHPSSPSTSIRSSTTFVVASFDNNNDDHQSCPNGVNLNDCQEALGFRSSRRRTLHRFNIDEFDDDEIEGLDSIENISIPASNGSFYQLDVLKSSKSVILLKDKFIESNATLLEDIMEPKMDFSTEHLDNNFRNNNTGNAEADVEISRAKLYRRKLQSFQKFFKSVFMKRESRSSLDENEF